MRYLGNTSAVTELTKSSRAWAARISAISNSSGLLKSNANLASGCALCNAVMSFLTRAVSGQSIPFSVPLCGTSCEFTAAARQRIPRSVRRAISHARPLEGRLRLCFSMITVRAIAAGAMDVRQQGRVPYLIGAAQASVVFGTATVTDAGG